MEVILVKDIDNNRKANDIITVKPGFARNYLIPQGIAILATVTNKKILQENLRQKNDKKNKLIKEADILIEKLKNIKLTLPVKAGSEGKIFGSIMPLQIAEALQKYYNITIESKNIIITEQIKELGSYKIKVTLFEGISTDLNIDVVGQTNL